MVKLCGEISKIIQAVKSINEFLVRMTELSCKLLNAVWLKSPKGYR